MWIHLPSTLLASVQDTQESNLDSEKLSQLEQSAMWKSKFLQQRSWQSVWKRDTSIKLLSGLTSKPSTLNHGVEKWISSLGDSHVNPFRLQDSNEEKMTKETYGLTQPDLFGGLGHQSSFLKMCQESSNTISVKSDPNFERWVTKLRKDYSQRSKQAHLTNDNAFSSWRTPAATDPEGGVEDWSSERFKNIEAPQIKLRDQAANWPTPRQRDHKDGMASTTSLVNGKFVRTSNTTGTKYGAGLDGAAANWPTPDTTDFGGHMRKDNNYNPETGEGRHSMSLGHLASNWPTPTTQEIAHEDMEVNDKGRRLTKDKEDSHSLNLQDRSRSWSTPKASDQFNKYQTENWRGDDLPSESHVWRETVQKEVERWPTPTVAEADKIGNRPNYGQQGLSNHPALVGKVEREKMNKSRAEDGKSTNPDNWGTPAHRDYKGFDGPGKKNKGKPSETYLSIHQDPMTQKDGHTCSVSCRRLNPLFAEHLMGLPLGWTCVSEPLEMELYQQWQQELSSFLYRN